MRNQQRTPNSGEDTNSKMADLEGDPQHVVYGIVDLLRAKLNSQANDSFTFGFEKSESKQSISNNEGQSHSLLNDGDKESEVARLFKMRESRPIQRQGSGYTSPSKSSSMQASNRFLRWSSSRVSTEMQKSLKLPIDPSQEEDVFVDLADSDLGTPNRESELRQLSVRHKGKSRGKFEEEKGLKSPSTFKQRFLSSQLVRVKTSEFLVQPLALQILISISENDQLLDFSQFSLTRIKKSKIVLTQYCELRDPSTTKLLRASSLSKPVSPVKIQNCLPPTPEKSASNLSGRRSPKLADLSRGRQPVIDPYACFKHKANSHELVQRKKPGQRHNELRNDRKMQLNEKIQDIRPQRHADDQSDADGSDEKSMFSEFSDLKRSQAVGGRLSTSRSAIVHSKQSPRERKRRSHQKQSLREVMEINEGSGSQDNCPSPQKKINLGSTIFLHRKTMLFAGIFFVLLIEAIILIRLSDT